MNKNRLFRDIDNKVIGGVAAGLAEYLQIDVVLVRVLFVMGFFVPSHFPVFIFYIVLWIAMPKKAVSRDHFQNPTVH